MMQIKGQTIILYVKREIGKDEFNSPIFEEVPENVDNVLIQPNSDTEILNDIQLYGKRTQYTIHVPKNDTHNWEDSTIEFYGQKWITVGHGVIYDKSLTPLDWNKQIKVVAYD